MAIERQIALDATREPLDQVKKLLRDFLDEKMTAGEFQDAFFPIARILRDIALDLAKARPDLTEEFMQIFKLRSQGIISQQEFENRRTSLNLSLGDIEVGPYSAKEEALGHLWVEVDAYREDLSESEPGQHIGEEELRQVVLETLAVLES